MIVDTFCRDKECPACCDESLAGEVDIKAGGVQYCRVYLDRDVKPVERLRVLYKQHIVSTRE
jgi:hypothetical protein